MTRRSFFLNTGSVVVASLLVGCGGGGGKSRDNSRAPDLMVLPAGSANIGPRYFTTDGREVDEAAVKTLAAKLLIEGGPGMLISSLDQAPAKNADGRWGFSIGCYRIMGRLDDGPVGACINRGRKHINFQVKNWCSNRDLFNYHVTGWWENGPQAGIYNSTTGWCAQSRGTFTEIRDKIARTHCKTPFLVFVLVFWLRATHRSSTYCLVCFLTLRVSRSKNQSKLLKSEFCNEFLPC